MRSWLSVLEATFLIHQLPPWTPNVRKRAVRARKLHFVDTGLACHLLGIHRAAQLRTHPLRGPLFESWVAGEVLKHRANEGLAPALHHYREVRGPEVDLVVDDGTRLVLVESKSGATIGSDWLDSLVRLRDGVGDW